MTARDPLASAFANVPPLTACEPAEVHMRTICYWGGHWWARCTCGWVSGGCVDQVQAETTPCEIEVLLLESQIRLRRLYGG